MSTPQTRVLLERGRTDGWRYRLGFDIDGNPPGDQKEFRKHDDPVYDRGFTEGGVYAEMAIDDGRVPDPALPGTGPMTFADRRACQAGYSEAIDRAVDLEAAGRTADMYDLTGPGWRRGRITRPYDSPVTR